MIHSRTLADEAQRVYTNGKEFAYDRINWEEAAPFEKGNDKWLNLRVNPQRRSLKAILLLFGEPYVAGTRDAEKYVNPDLTKDSVSVNGSPNKLYSNAFESMEIWGEARRYFMQDKNKTQHMNVEKCYTDDKFCLLIDFYSMADHAMQESGTRLVNTKAWVQLELERNASGSGKVNCYVFVISDSQMNTQGRQLESVMY